MSQEEQSKWFSGERLTAVYTVVGDREAARARAEDICLEQTVELPDALVTDAVIRAEVIGRIETMEQVDRERWRARISFATETIGGELTQLLNVLYGNTSLKPGVRLESVELPDSLARQWQGPRYGVDGLRAYLDVPARPLLCTALKPMGSSPEELGELAFQLALGGIDLIKDDHGLTDQTFAPFKKRVSVCGEAVARANARTGGRSVYVPNVTAPAAWIQERARFAKENGAGALMICPGLTGLDAMRALADDDTLSLPLLAHPALQGSMIASRTQGVSHACVFGQWNRLAGADAAIFPNAGGRFAFTEEDCRELVEGCRREMAGLRPIWPCPAGGMSLGRVREMLAMYGRDVIFLVGGGLRSHSPDLIANCRYFREMAEAL